MTRATSTALLVIGASVVAATACSYGVAERHGAAPPGAADLFSTAVVHAREHHGWPLRVDPRVMDSIPTAFNFERDVVIAPTPSFAAAPREERRRGLVLARLGVPRETVDSYTACTPYIGGVPVERRGVTPEWRAAADSARRACADRASYAVAIFGAPRQAVAGRSWKIRYYFVNAVTRQVVDLELARSGREWAVIGREELLSVSS